MRQIVRLLTLAIYLQVAPLAWAIDRGVETQANPNAITILFVNGIRNDKTSTSISSEALIKSLRAGGLPQAKYSFDYFYNPTDGGLDDTAEVVQQAKISDAFLKEANGNRSAYYQLLGNYYNEQISNLGALSELQKRVVSVAAQLKGSIENILAPRAGGVPAGLVIVPHSQGNLYVEAAYAMLHADGKASVISKIRVVGVASAAATTPSNRYITHTTDKVISNEYGLTHQSTGLYLNYFSPLEFNETACLSSFCGGNISNAAWAFIDPPLGAAHGFQNVYLNPQLTSQSSGKGFPSIIYNFVSSSLAEIETTTGPTTLFDDFNRPDGAVGNGWTAMADNVNGTLLIAQNKLTVSGPNGRAGIYRQADLTKFITASATITQENGFYGYLLNRYTTGFLFGSTTNSLSGYGVYFSRGDSDYSDSAIVLVLNGVQVGIIPLPANLQFGTSLNVTARYSPSDGSMTGSVLVGVTTFAYSFPPLAAARATALPGSNFGIDQGFPGGNLPPLTLPTIDNLSLVSGD